MKFMNCARPRLFHLKSIAMNSMFPKGEKSQQSKYQQQSKFTLLIYFKDGYTSGMKFHSFKHDQRKFGGNTITDQRYSLNRLVSLVEDRFKDQYKTAILYDNETNTQLLKWSYGMMKDFEEFQWEYFDNGDIKLKIAPPKARMTPARKNEIARYRF